MLFDRGMENDFFGCFSSVVDRGSRLCLYNEWIEDRRKTHFRESMSSP